MDHIIIIGAGLSGIGMGIQLKQQLNFTNFTIYERQSSIGGTWARNTYPNLSCDVPSELYSYSFYQKPDWKYEFASQPEILAYMRQCITHFELQQHIQLEQDCLSVEWQPQESCWVASLVNLQDGKKYQKKGQFLISAMGIVSNPKGVEEIPALKNFSGPIFHTANWRDIDWLSKRVVVIGNGCSANQVIPWVLKEGDASKLVQIVRSDQWIAPKENKPISPLRTWIYKYVPFVMKIHRIITAWKMDQGFLAFKLSEQGNRARSETSLAVQAYMREQSNPMYHDLLLPTHEWGAKRPVLDHGYLKATNDERFELVKSDTIRDVTNGHTIEDAAGNKHEADVVILANGFKTQELISPVKVYGKDGQELANAWKSKGGQEAYMGVAVHRFPNFFILGGPNTLPAFHSTLHGLECNVVYIVRLLRSLQKRSQHSESGTRPTIEVTEVAQQNYMKVIYNKMEDLIYNRPVASYFINKKSGRNTLSWPGSQREFWWTRCIQAIKWEDWTIK